MTTEERNEYNDLLDYFLKRKGNVTSKSKIDRLNDLGRLSVDERKRRNLTDSLNFKWIINQA